MPPLDIPIGDADRLPVLCHLLCAQAVRRDGSDRGDLCNQVVQARKRQYPQSADWVRKLAGVAAVPVPRVAQNNFIRRRDTMHR